jgi:hypothetical protein
MRARVVVACAVVMMVFGALSVLEKPVRADAGGGCCVPSNPYHCGGNCQDVQTCTLYSGTCPA